LKLAFMKLGALLNNLIQQGKVCLIFPYPQYKKYDHK
jgi:hypothetical protein